MDKPDFLCKAAYAALAEKAPREKLVMIEVEADIADASGGEPILLPDSSPAGPVSSGAYGFSVGKSLALGFIKTPSAVAGTAVSVAVLGRPHRGVILAEPAFDPAGARLRG
ncbi:glycine cleavage T C-terminal barrel domain-containing protein [Defluviimonas sp. SAOS-178_SWC]|uniref:glycine cleavage T C-terminal barrel domain-containing protein n=1 Tax=Defluviimonas sp. SAOS-178_SWC TaxID=3121287 RepID=UPI003D80AB03